MNHETRVEAMQGQLSVLLRGSYNTYEMLPDCKSSP
jgi:hypothetical protein